MWPGGSRLGDERCEQLARQLRDVQNNPWGPILPPDNLGPEELERRLSSVLFDVQRLEQQRQTRAAAAAATAVPAAAVAVLGVREQQQQQQAIGSAAATCVSGVVAGQQSKRRKVELDEEAWMAAALAHLVMGLNEYMKHQAAAAAFSGTAAADVAPHADFLTILDEPTAPAAAAEQPQQPAPAAAAATQQQQHNQRLERQRPNTDLDLAVDVAQLNARLRNGDFKHWSQYLNPPMVFSLGQQQYSPAGTCTVTGIDVFLQAKARRYTAAGTVGTGEERLTDLLGIRSNQMFLDKAMKGGWVLLARQHGVQLADLTPLRPLFDRLERTPQADEAVVQVLRMAAANMPGGVLAACTGSQKVGAAIDTLQADGISGFRAPRVWSTAADRAAANRRKQATGNAAASGSKKKGRGSTAGAADWLWQAEMQAAADAAAAAVGYKEAAPRGRRGGSIEQQ